MLAGIGCYDVFSGKRWNRWNDEIHRCCAASCR